MEPDSHTKRGRLMGKLFGRDRKTSSPNEVAPGNDDLNSFLRRPDDPLPVAHPGPQMLHKLDTATARRYPNAHELNSAAVPPPQPSPRLNQQAQMPLRGRPQSTKINPKKSLIVRFVDTFPEVIGEGGDECSIPTAEIGKRRRAQSAPHKPPPPMVSRTVAQLQERDRSQSDAPPKPQDDFVPPPIRRTQTGFSTIGDEPDSPPLPPPPPARDAHNIPVIPAGNSGAAPFLDSPVISSDDKRKSFIEINQARQREAEGMAFAEARKSMSANTEREWEEQRQNAVIPSTPNQSDSRPPSLPNPETPELLQRRPPLDQSPGSVYSQKSHRASPAMAQRWPSVRDKNTNDSPSLRNSATDGTISSTMAPPDDALELFLDRTRHLFELFRLSAESVKPIMSCLPEDLARAALWWFLKGRSALEMSIREERQNPQNGAQTQAARQQAYADLTKALWIFEEILPRVLETRSSPVDVEVPDVGQTILSQLRKLASSMKRNGYLPPEQAFLPQTIDKSIWLEYPAINQDIIALLWGSWSSSIAAQQGPLTGMPLLAALPLGDTTDLFCFGRYVVDLYLMEQGMEEQKFHFPCFLSVIRPPTQASLDFSLASQNGAVQLRIQSNKKAGPTWNDVKWRAENYSLELKLPRGFIVVVKLRPQDFKILWSMQDYSSKATTTLQPRKEEQCVFRSTLRNFQYFDSNPQSMVFPKEAVPSCDIALFERIARENSPTGPRVYHRGFRLAIVTGPVVKLLSAVNHMYPPHIPVQFGFLRGEHGEPALLLRYDEGKNNGRMVMAFNDEPERLRFHSLLIGTLVQQDEKIYSEVPIVGYSLSETARSNPIQVFSQLPWSRAKVINEDIEDLIPETVLSERLRVVIDFKCGSITDRINVGPGELKIRLPVKDKTSLMILRPSQQDMTVALSESQISKQVPGELYQAMQLTTRSQTVRTISFTSQRDLHDFEQALTGFKVHFDGVVSLFAISRRRMVVPIYKKWEATDTRIQVVESEENIIQVLVFFENFHHGESMSFQLKATDVFESIKKGDKVGLKIDDAKFPLPLLPEEKGEPTDDMAFVCLDMPEIPGEHDDITILFDGEEQRDDFFRCLPAPIKGSRMSRTFK
ncbi:hypothetical protein N0V82_004706 [Gnomoniopsis sp. IMI 355080]|nr:hypothetical protein N0V82_004706 [Gnomoniopsis sp. IMI 355080]